jgi:hypothetical protein
MEKTGNPAFPPTPEDAMRPRFVRLGCAALLTAGLAAGCQSTAGTAKPYPKDPLLLSKKPIEGGLGTPITAPTPPQLASAEPAQPQVPTTALVSGTAPPTGISSVPRPYNGYVADRSTVAARPVATIKAPLEATPAVRSSAAQASNFGHAPDHRWLQGVLDKHYQGHFNLRYCDASVDDSWGGKVRLEDDPRLAQFQDGDVIRVEGVLVPKDDKSPTEAWHRYPHYRIESVELIQRKN